MAKHNFNGLAVNQSPLLSRSFFGLPKADMSNLVVFKKDYQEVASGEDVCTWITNMCKGNTIAVWYKVKVNTPNAKPWDEDSRMEMRTAIYFASKQDVVAFKLAYNELIDFVEMPRERGETFDISIDMDKVRAKAKRLNQRLAERSGYNV